MGVDASYLYGYCANVEEIAWNIEFLREKYKDDMESKLGKFSFSLTAKELIEHLITVGTGNESFDWYDIADTLGMEFNCVYDQYILSFNHFKLIEKYPDRKLSELDDLVKEYLIDIGVDNPAVFRWEEFGYFD